MTMTTPHYTVTVSANNRHLFTTDGTGSTTLAEGERLARLMAERFPVEHGFTVTLCSVECSAREVEGWGAVGTLHIATDERPWVLFNQAYARHVEAHKRLQRSGLGGYVAGVDGNGFLRYTNDAAKAIGFATREDAKGWVRGLASPGVASELMREMTTEHYTRGA